MVALVLRPQEKTFHAGLTPGSHKKPGIFEDSKGSYIARTHGEGERNKMGWLLQQLHFIKPTN